MVKTKKGRPICIRNIQAFKDGCPESADCPCWKVRIVGTRGNPLEKVPRGQCIDLWTDEIAWSTLGAIEALQATMEDFRNNMSQPGMPKPDPALVELVQIVRARMGEALPGAAEGKKIPH